MAEADWLPSYISQNVLCKHSGWRRKNHTGFGFDWVEQL